ncbi:MAG TPA: type II toxin-antitoxin system PemK/MazF family toxin [Rhodoblastus sp.]|nr:type II toxin-antitoxin system PemK/MazF family toxin [Rhodoblastus sp.]
MTDLPYVPDAGDLIWTDFDPPTGREQGGRRPALVLSPDLFTRKTGFAIVAPITSRVRPYPTSVVLPEGSAVQGEILLSHLRSIDILARPMKFAGGKISVDMLDDLRTKLGALITI